MGAMKYGAIKVINRQSEQRRLSRRTGDNAQAII